MEVFLQEHTCVRNLLGCEQWKEQKGDPLEVGLVTSVLSLSGDTEGNVLFLLPVCVWGREQGAAGFLTILNFIS